MKNIIKALVVITIVTITATASVGSALAQNTSYYGPSGGYAGSSSTFGNNTSFYGPGGGYLGSARRY